MCNTLYPRSASWGNISVSTSIFLSILLLGTATNTLDDDSTSRSSRISVTVSLWTRCLFFLSTSCDVVNGTIVGGMMLPLSIRVGAGTLSIT